MADNDTYYWVGGSGDYNTGYATHWATASGGAVFFGSAPNSTNPVVFDEHSNEPGDGDYTVSLAAGYMWSKGMTFTNPPSGVITCTCAGPLVLCYGSLTLAVGMTFSVPNVLIRDTATVTSNGVTIPSGIGSDAGATIDIADDLVTSSGGVVDMPTGVLNTNDHNINCGYFRDLSGTGTLNLGSSTITVINTVDFSLGGTIINAGTSVINCSGAFSGGGKTYATVNLTSSTITGLNTFSLLNIAGGTCVNSTDIQTTADLTIAAGATFSGTVGVTVTDDYTCNATGVHSNTGTITCSAADGLCTFATGGVTISSSNVILTGAAMTTTGAGTFSKITLQSDSAQTLTLLSDVTTTFTSEGILARNSTGGHGGGKKTVQSSAASLATLSKTGGFLMVDLAGGAASWLGKAGTSLGVITNWGSVTNCSTSWNRWNPGSR